MVFLLHFFSCNLDLSKNFVNFYGVQSILSLVSKYFEISFNVNDGVSLSVFGLSRSLSRALAVAA